MAFFVVLVLVIVVGTAYSIYNTVSAKQAVDLEVTGNRQEILARANAYFGRTWSRVGGPGDLNVEPAMRVKPATLSVSVIDLRPGVCGVSIWTSSWTSRYGLMGHAQLARRKKNGLAAALAGAKPVAA